MRLSAFETYTLYLALKNHFGQESYDFFRYHGKTGTSHDAFMRRKDRLQFQKLSRRHSDADMKDYIIANILAGRTWVGEMLDDEAEDIFLAYRKRHQSLSYMFANELDKAFSEVEPKKFFRANRNSYPEVVMHVLSNRISPETFTLLNIFIGFAQNYDQKYGADDTIWSKARILCVKYAPFLEYDRNKLKGILKDKIKEYEHGEEQEASRTASAA